MDLKTTITNSNDNDAVSFLALFLNQSFYFCCIVFAVIAFHRIKMSLFLIFFAGVLLKILGSNMKTFQKKGIIFNLFLSSL